MYIWLNCIYLYLNVYCQCLMLTVCTKGLRVTQFQFSVCMYCTCGRIDNKARLDLTIVFGPSLWATSKSWLKGHDALNRSAFDPGVCLSWVWTQRLYGRSSAAQRLCTEGAHNSVQSPGYLPSSTAAIDREQGLTCHAQCECILSVLRHLDSPNSSLCASEAALRGCRSQSKGYLTG